MRNIFTYVVMIWVFAFTVPFVSLAQTAGNPPTPTQGTPDFSLNVRVMNPLGDSPNTNFESILARILDLVQKIALPIVVLMVIYSGFKYVIARGNPEAVEKAHQSLTWTLVGAAVLLGANLISSLLVDTVKNLSSDAGITTPSGGTGSSGGTTGGAASGGAGSNVNRVTSCANVTAYTGYTTSVSGTYIVNTQTDPLQIRCGPAGTTDNTLILNKIYQKSEEITVLGAVGSWYKTSLGWVNSNLLKAKVGAGTTGGATAGGTTTGTTTGSGTTTGGTASPAENKLEDAKPLSGNTTNKVDTCPANTRTLNTSSSGKYKIIAPSGAIIRCTPNTNSSFYKFGFSSGTTVDVIGSVVSEDSVNKNIWYYTKYGFVYSDIATKQ